MNAIKMLKQDHKKVKDLFREYEAAGERAHRKKERLAEEIFIALEVHTMIEEEVFYPAFKAKADREGKKLVAEALEEHQAVGNLIEELQDIDPEDEEYEEKFTTLVENVEKHIEEEEGDMFPQVEEKLGDQLDDLGMEMEKYKEQLMTAT